MMFMLKDLPPNIRVHFTGPTGCNCRISPYCRLWWTRFSKGSRVTTLQVDLCEPGRPLNMKAVTYHNVIADVTFFISAARILDHVCCV